MMLQILRLIFIILILLFAQVCHSQQLHLSNREYSSEQLNGEFQWYLDSTENLTIDEFLNLKVQKSPMPNLNFFDGAVWLRLDIVNESHPSDWYFEIAHPPLDSVECFVFVADSLIYHELTGDDFKFSKRSIQTAEFTFPVHLNASKEYSIIFRIQGERNIFVIPLNAYAEANWIAHIQSQRIFQGLSYGVLLIAVILGMVSYIVTRVNTHLYYGIYVFAVLIFFMTQTGHWFQYVLPNLPSIYNMMPITMASMGGIFSILFAREILSIKRGKLSIFLLLLAILMFIAPFIQLVNFRLALFTSGTASFIKVISFCIITIVYALKGNNTAKYLFPAWFIYALGIVMFMLRNFGVVPPGFWSSNGLFLATIAEVLILSIAVAVSYRQLVKDHVIASESAKRRELELAHAANRENRLRQEKEEKDRKLATSLLKDKRRIEKLTSLTQETSDSLLRQKIEKLIHSDRSSTNYWENFRLIFEDVHPRFFESLQRQYPQLSINDLRHLAYVKMNLQVKEISELTGVSVQAVKMARNRLRKKIDQDKTLSEIVLQF